MPSQTELDAQEARLQQQLRIAQMKVQLGKTRAELWAIRLPMAATVLVLLMALVCFGLVTLTVMREFMH